MKTTTSLLIFLFANILQFSAQNWTGNVSSDWNNSANFSSTPLNGSTIIIDPINYTGTAAPPIVSVNSNFNPGAIVVQNSGILTVGATLTLLGNIEIANAELNLISGTFGVGNCFTLENGGNISVQNGILNITDSLTIINGGQFDQNGGLVNIEGEFSLIDGNNTVSSTYAKNAGTLNVFGNTHLECFTGNYSPKFINYTLNSTFYGDIFWNGSGVGSGSPKFESYAGIMNIMGVVENKPNSTVDLFFRLAGSAFLNFYGNRWETISLADSVIQAEGTTFIFYDTNLFINQGVFYSKGITMMFDKVLVLGNGSFQFDELYIYGFNSVSKVLYHQTTSPIKISGDFILSGDFVSNSNAILFNGTGAQTIYPSLYLDTTKFYNIEIDNVSTSGVFITNLVNGSANNNVILVHNHLQLTAGVLNIGEFTHFKLLDNATASNGNNNSFVSGPIYKIGDDPFVFPVGKNGRWRRIGMSAPNSVTSAFKAEYFDNSPNTISPVNAPLMSVSNLEYWNLNQTQGTDSIQIELYWEDASVSAITNCNAISIANWNGNSWDDNAGSTSGSCVLQNSGIIQSISELSNFGEFTFGFYNGVTTQNFSLCFGDQINVGINLYDATGTYFDNLLDINGNDSLVITQLLINNPIAQIVGNYNSIGAMNQTGDSYIWRDCSGNTFPSQTLVYFDSPVSGIYQLIQNEGACSDTSDCVYFTRTDTTICDGSTLQVGSQIYSYAGVYSENLLSSNGLDSIVNTNLQVITSNQGIDFVGTALGAISSSVTLQWIECSGISIPGATQNLFTPSQSGIYALVQTIGQCTDTSECVFYTITDTSICLGETYQIDTSIYSATGTYINLLIAQTSLMDSFAVTNLNVVLPNLTTTTSGATITSNSYNVTYQWINCYNYSSISNETNQSYTASVNGSYAVEVNEDGCIDTSDCITIINVGIDEADQILPVQVYPNPFSSVITINLNGNDYKYFTIRNTLGQILKEGKLNQKLTLVNSDELSKGIYYLEIGFETEKSVLKLVKN